MNHFRMIGAAMIALSTTAGSAMAADVVAPPPVYTPPPAPVVVDAFTWQGAYAGALIGYGWGEFDGDDANAAFGGDFDANGWLAGGFIGYNADLGNFVVGGEVDAAWTNISGSNANVPPVEGNINALATARVRAGYDLGRVLVYGTGGLAVGMGELTGGPAALAEENTHIGWTVGAGVDVAVTDNIFARAEYKYVDLGSETYGVAGDVDFTAHVVSAGVGFKF